MRNKVIVVAFAAICVGLALWLVLTARSNWDRAQQSGLPPDCRATFGWLDKDHPTPAADGSLEMPSRLGDVAADDKAWLLEGASGRCLLLKRELRPKDNFAGDLCCERDLPAAHDTAGRPLLSLGPRPPFEELYQASRETSRWAKVVFDLN
ncbi:MAG: hypothetical protein AMXMBFR64_50410 [Myxococcales bacterium]